MSDISREELAAFSEAHSKSAVALEKVSQTMAIIIENQEKIKDKLRESVSEHSIDDIKANQDKMCDDIKECILQISDNQKKLSESFDNKFPAILSEKITTSTMARDIEHTKWLVGIIGLAIIIVTVLSKVFISPPPSAIDKSLQHLLEQHMEATEGNKGVVYNGKSQ
jgi:hypothetical protein